MKQATANDNAIGWHLEGPDEDGLVLLIDNGPTHQSVIALGRFDDVAARLADWLAEKDFGERPA